MEKKPRLESDSPRGRLRRDNRKKAVRTVVQIVLLAYVIIFFTVSAVQRNTLQKEAAAPSVDAAYDSGGGEKSSFIAISYPGLTRSKSLTSKLVNKDVFAEQIEALKASGYVTISQADIINYYFYFGGLPQKALFLIFEDGIRDTTSLAQDVLDANAYRATICTYANNLADVNSKFVTAADLKALVNNGRWEMGTNGYRISYINVFDRYGNYFGHLNGNEFLQIQQYLWRDYNHFLMDFKRDRDRLREESAEELRLRIENDYEQMQSKYMTELKQIPNLYILMHSNTGAFGTDPTASEANRAGLTNLFTMNFNRQGSCLNTLDSSIYDLSRLQVQSYFSTNHLLMRIKDDINGEVAFVTGDEREADHWYVDEGVAEFKGNEIVLTTTPMGKGWMTLKQKLMLDLDMTVTLQGNLLGCQSINLRSDRSLKRGIQVALENNDLVVRSLEQNNAELFRRSLFEFDGGPFISKQEDEYNGLVALQKAIIQYDEDAERVEEAKAKLAELENTPVVTLEAGGTPYYPEVDISDRGNRKLRIRLVGSRLSVWIDEKPMVDQLLVSAPHPGNISFGAQVYIDDDKYSQRYLYDDVYDAVFVDPVIYDAQNTGSLLYSYTLTQSQTFNSVITRWFNNIVNFFLNNF